MSAPRAEGVGKVAFEAGGEETFLRRTKIYNWNGMNLRPEMEITCNLIMTFNDMVYNRYASIVDANRGDSSPALYFPNVFVRTRFLALRECSVRSSKCECRISENRIHFRDVTGTIRNREHFAKQLMPSINLLSALSILREEKNTIWLKCVCRYHRITFSGTLVCAAMDRAASLPRIRDSSQTLSAQPGNLFKV